MTILYYIAGISILLAVLVVLFFSGRKKGGGYGGTKKISGEDMLKMKYVKGRINKKEYDKRREDMSYI